MRRAHTPPDAKKNTGSPDSGEPEFLVVGKLTHTHGVRGELLMLVWTDFPERLVPGVTLYVGPQREPLELVSCRGHSKGLLVSFAGHQSREFAARLTNQLVHVKASDRPPLPPGEFYHHQLLGLTVLDETGEELGNLEQILTTGANDVYLVRSSSGKEILLPAIESVILDIDLVKRQISVHILPGLLENK